MGLWFDVHNGTDPNGAALGRLERVLAAEVRMALFPDLGGGKVSIGRTDAQVGLLQKGRYLKVGLDAISDTVPIWGIWLHEGRDELLAIGEEVAEVLTWGGSGPMYYLADAKLWHLPFAGQIGTRPGTNKWHWPNNRYGDIALRLINEAQARSADLIPAVTTDWDHLTDSDGTAWPVFTGMFTLDIGTDYVGDYRTLTLTGEFQPVMHPDFLLQGFVTYGRDLTGAFGAGTVRLEKGVNIVTGLAADMVASRDATHALVGGSDGTYVEVERPSYDPGDVRRETFIPAGELTDPADLTKRGEEELRRKEDQAAAFELGFLVGDNPAGGYYLPGGHVVPGDSVSVHTGSGTHEYDEATERVYAIRIVMRDADGPDDQGVDAVLELSAGAGGGEDIGTGLGDDECCGPGSQIQPPVICDEEEVDITAEGTVGAQFLAGGSSDIETIRDGDENTNPGIIAPHESTRFFSRDLGASFPNQYHRIVQTAGAGNISSHYFLASSTDDITYTVRGEWFGDHDTGFAATGSSDRYWRTYSVAGPNGWAVMEWQVHSGSASVPAAPGVPDSGEGPCVELQGHVHPPAIEATAPPTVTDDEDAGRAVGNVWVDTATNKAYVLVDATPGAAVWIEVAAGPAVTDHGALTGLGDDDHTQYQKESEKGAASGYASLDSGTKVPTAELGTGTADATKVLRGDRTWAVPPVSAFDDLSDVTITSPAVADRPRYDGAVWRNSALIWTPVSVMTGSGPEVVFDAAGHVVMAEV